MVRVGDIKVIIDKMGGIGGMFQRHAITKDKKAYIVYPLDIDEAELEDEVEALYIGDVSTLEIEEVKTQHRIVMDAIEVHVYEIDGEVMKLRYRGMSEFDRLPSIATEVLNLANSFKEDTTNKAKLRSILTRRANERSCKTAEVARRTLGE